MRPRLIDGIIAENGADPDLRAELELMAARRQNAEKRLILPDRLALVVEYGPTAADPARADHGTAISDGSGVRLNFLLDLAAEAVRIAEIDLHRADCSTSEVAPMDLAGQRRREHRLPGCLVRRGCLAGLEILLHVVNNAGRRRPEQGSSQGMWIIRRIKRVDLRLRQIGREGGKESPTFCPALPITAVPTTKPRASNIAPVWLPLGSVTSVGASTR